MIQITVSRPYAMKDVESVIKICNVNNAFMDISYIQMKRKIYHASSALNYRKPNYRTQSVKSVLLKFLIGYFLLYFFYFI
jgi:hypothetical protein